MMLTPSRKKNAMKGVVTDCDIKRNGCTPRGKQSAYFGDNPEQNDGLHIPNVFCGFGGHLQ